MPRRTKVKVNNKLKELEVSLHMKMDEMERLAQEKERCGHHLENVLKEFIVFRETALAQADRVRFILSEMQNIIDNQRLVIMEQYNAIEQKNQQITELEAQIIALKVENTKEIQEI
jgi:hypothetical protein